MSMKELLVGNGSYGKGSRQPMVDITKGGQFGFSNNYAEWLSSTPHTSRNTICKVLSLPAGFRDVEDGVKIMHALKAMFELHPKRIDGIQNSLSYEHNSVPFGAGGQIFEQATNATRTPAEPTFTWDERRGRPIQTILEYWGTELIMDPDTKYPNIITRTGAKPTDFLPYYYTATLLFIEPDPTHQFVDKALLCSNVMPKNAGQKEWRKDQTSGGQLLEHSIPFTAISMGGPGVDALAQRFLNEMTMTGAAPSRRPAFVDKVTAEVKSGQKGYAEDIAAAGRAAIPL